MKLHKLIILTAAFLLIISTFTGCIKSDDNKILSTIQAFMSAIEKGNIDDSITRLDPDIQTMIKNGTNSFGSIIGFANAFETSVSLSSRINTVLKDSTQFDIKLKYIEVLSKKIEESSAIIYVNYNVSLPSNLIYENISQDSTFEFQMIKKNGNWYIKTMKAIDDSIVVEAYTNGLNIKRATSFSDGVAFAFIGDNDICVAIDTEGNTLFELSLSDFPDAFSNGITIIDKTLINKKGEVIASPELSGYDGLLSKNSGGYVLAYKYGETYDNVSCEIGVLDNTGAWYVPLSSNHPLLEFLKNNNVSPGEWLKNPPVLDKKEDAVFIITLGIFVDTYYYDVKDNKIYNGYTHFENRFYQGEETGIYKYDNTGAKKIFLKDKYLVEDYGTALLCENGLSSSVYSLYDYNGNMIMDLSQYNIYSTTGTESSYCNGNLLLQIVNESNTRYLCVIGRNGELLFEPIKIEENVSWYSITDDGFIYSQYEQFGKTSYFFYDLTGNKVEYSNIYGINNFSNGLALVYSTGWQHYYINTKGEIIIV